jgi:predicted ATPase
LSFRVDLCGGKAIAQLALAFLGPPLITVDGRIPSTALWTKTVALLAYLALETPRPHRREALAGLLWPEQPEAKAREDLRQALYLLRQALGEEFLQVTAQSIQLNAAADITVDVLEFTALVEGCRRHSHRSLAGCRTCAARLERAVALYRGELLAGFFPRDSTALEEWMTVRREQLRDQALWALEALAEHHARLGDYARMKQLARRQIEIDPLSEVGHRQLMRALTWSGRPNAAVAALESLRKLLERELGVPPEDETIALGETLRAGRLAPPGGPQLYRWPAPLSPLVDREDELGQLANWLSSPTPQLVTIVGTGGVGKTRLALEAAAQQAVAFAEGACFVPLETVSSPSLFPQIIAAALGIALSGPQDPHEQLLESLRDRDLLLVLDNFEHLLVAAPRVTELLAACPRLKILATSREPLHLRSEQLLLLEPLGLPDLEHLPADRSARIAMLAHTPAVELFALRARTVQPAFSLDEANSVPVAEICTRLEGLPLAIELVVPLVRTVPLTQLRDRLEHRLAALVDGARDLPERQRTLRTALTWSYELLTEAQKRLLAWLAVFPAGATLSAVQAVCLNGIESDTGAEPAVLSTLCAKNLLKRQQVGEQARYTMLETVREYAQERLVERGKWELAQGQHAAYYLAMAEQGAVRLVPAPQPGALEQLETESANFRAALRWVTEQNQVETALRLAGALWRFWHLRNSYQEGLRWLREALSLPLPGAPASPEQERLIPYRIEALTGAGAICSAIQQELGLAIAYLEEAAVLARQSGAAASLPRILALLGRAAESQQDAERALGAYQEGLALARAGGPERLPSAAYILNAVGNILRNRGDYAEARAHYQEALAVWREIGDPNGTTCGLCNLGTLACLCGDPEQALHQLRQSLLMAQENNDLRHAAYSLLGLAAALPLRGKPVLAARLLGQSEALFRSLGIDPVSFDQPLYDSATAAIGAVLGKEALCQMREEGAAMDLDTAAGLVSGEEE